MIQLVVQVIKELVVGDKSRIPQVRSEVQTIQLNKVSRKRPERSKNEEKARKAKAVVATAVEATATIAVEMKKAMDEMMKMSVSLVSLNIRALRHVPLFVCCFFHACHRLFSLMVYPSTEADERAVAKKRIFWLRPVVRNGSWNGMLMLLML